MVCAPVIDKKLINHSCPLSYKSGKQFCSAHRVCVAAKSFDQKPELKKRIHIYMMTECGPLNQLKQEGLQTSLLQFKLYACKACMESIVMNCDLNKNITPLTA